MPQLRSRNRNYLITERPFEGGPGVKMYVGLGAPENILYRPARVFLPSHPPLVMSAVRDVSVATVESPTTEIDYTLPDDYVGEEVWYQLRTYQDDVENESLYRPRRLETDVGGDGADSIYGKAVVVRTQKRDSGGLRITFVWRSARDGIQPTTFTVVKTSGSGTIADVDVTVDGDGEYTADVVGLTNDVAYTFRIDGVNGALTVVLVSEISFVGDTSGPPAVTNVVTSEA